MAEKFTCVLSALIVLSSLLCEVEARVLIYTYVPVTTLSAGVIVAIVVSVLVFICLLGVCLVKCLASGSRSGRVINPHSSVTVVQPYSLGQNAGYRLGGAGQFYNYYGNAKVPEPPPYSQPSASPPAYLDPAYPPVNARTPASTFGQSILPGGTTPSPRNLTTAGSTNRSLFPPGTSASQRPPSGATAPVARSTSGVPSAPGIAVPPGTAGSMRPQSVAPAKTGFASITSPWS